MPHEYGDLVLLSRGQATLVAVLTSPPPAGDLYWIDLPINESVRRFEFAAPGTATINEIAAALEATLQNDQTVYSVAIADPPWTLMVVGPPGSVYDAVVSSNLTATVTEEAVRGARDRPIRVLEAKTRWTRTRDRESLEVEQIVGRELEDHKPFGFRGSDVKLDLGKERYTS